MALKSINGVVSVTVGISFPFWAAIFVLAHLQTAGASEKIPSRHPGVHTGSLGTVDYIEFIRICGRVANTRQPIAIIGTVGVVLPYVPNGKKAMRRSENGHLPMDILMI